MVERIGTFIAALSSVKIGVLFTLAMFLHKLPEGMVIALPIYYASGSKIKAFAISAGSATISQMLGALFAWLIFSRFWNNAVPAYLFAIVSGVLVYVVIHGLLPTSRRYDSNDKYVTSCFFLGIACMLLVDALFSYAE